MRYTAAPEAVINVVEDRYALAFRDPIPASPRVGVRTLPPWILPASGRADAANQPLIEEDYQRSGAERRRMCRRIYGHNWYLDTRGHGDRRRGGRRMGDVTDHVDLWA
jgi:hypothetical protein